MSPQTSRKPRIERIAGITALLGGLLAIAVAILASLSVFGRWLYSSPVPGDFEIVKMATAVAIFAYLPYTQARRSNIVVDTFTTGLSERARNLLDGFWDLTYAAIMGYIAYCLVFGTVDAIKSRETTMMLQWVLWPSIALSTALCILLAITAVATAWRLIRRPAGGASA